MVESSGPLYSLGAKLSEIQTGLNSVQKRLDERSPTVTQAKVTQKVSEGVTDRHGLEETSHHHLSHNREEKPCCVKLQN